MLKKEKIKIKNKEKNNNENEILFSNKIYCVQQLFKCPPTTYK